MIVGLCHGCFDVVHFGHINHLEAARALCDRLVVCLTPDEYVNKGPTRPVFPSEQRLRVIAALKCVDHAFVGEGPDVAINALKQVEPQRYFKGGEYANGHPVLAKERAFCAENGIQLLFTEQWPSSTTETLKRLGGAA